MPPLLSALWLAEPTDDTLARARALPALAPHCADPADLAVAFADLFLLNVFPYAGVFLDLRGELNGPRAHELESGYRQFGYAPAALASVASPDHLGLLLGLLDHAGPEAAPSLAARYALDWAPVLCLAVERERGAHPFYRALAALTHENIFDLTVDAPPPASLPLELEAVTANDEDEISLRAVVRHLLAPARSGVYLSRARLGGWGRDLGIRLPFGERFTVATSLFEAAGVSGEVPRLLDLLEAETRACEAAYAAWAVEFPARVGHAAAWRARAAATLRLLADMRSTAAAGLIGDADDADSLIAPGAIGE